MTLQREPFITMLFTIVCQILVFHFAQIGSYLSIVPNLGEKHPIKNSQKLSKSTILDLIYKCCNFPRLYLDTMTCACKPPGSPSLTYSRTRVNSLPGSIFFSIILVHYTVLNVCFASHQLNSLRCLH